MNERIETILKRVKLVLKKGDYNILVTYISALEAMVDSQEVVEEEYNGRGKKNSDW